MENSGLLGEPLLRVPLREDEEVKRFLLKPSNLQRRWSRSKCQHLDSFPPRFRQRNRSNSPNRTPSIMTDDLCSWLLEQIMMTFIADIQRVSLWLLLASLFCLGFSIELPYERQVKAKLITIRPALLPYRSQQRKISRYVWD
jgi:hypothetical protein